MGHSTTRAATLFLIFVILVSCSTPVKTSDNSRTSLDWKGVYSGVLPCADCSGILTRLTLREDLTYTLQTRYQGKPGEVLTTTGSFEWLPSGGTIRLGNISNGPSYYQVGENRLVQLDLEGKAIQGAAAASYVLAKEEAGITNKYWKLVELNGAPVVMNAGARREPHFILHTADRRVSGSGGCNNFTGTYELTTGDRVRFSPLAATKMACLDQGATETETRFLQVLGQADSYYLRGDSLQLNRARMAPLARFVAVYLR